MGKIILMVSKDEMLHQAHNILQEKKYPIDEIKVIKTENAVIEARTAIANGAEIIIARGLQASLIKQYTEIPVVEIVMTGQDMALLVTRAKQIVRKPRPIIAVVGFHNMFCDMSYFDTIYDIELRTYYARSGEDLQEAASKAAMEEVDLIIGGDTAVEVATMHGIPSLFLSITEDSLRTAFSVVERMNYAMNVEKRNEAQMETLLDYSFHGVIKIDSQGIITDVNLVMEDILECEEKDIVGKPITDALKDLDQEQLKLVLTKGEETYTLFTQVKHTAIYAILAPVKMEGVVYGAFLSCHKIKKQQPKEVTNTSRINTKSVARGNFSDLYQLSQKMKQCINEARLYSQSDRPVLIVGETGTESRLIAQGIHNNSLRNHHSYMEINCSSIAPEKQKDILFGDKGVISNLTLGTILLEDIHNLSFECQSQLVELIRYKVRSRNDLIQMEPMDVRVLASTSVSLLERMEAGDFRQDLFYVLNGLVVFIPPLRERNEDLKQLIKDCIKESCDMYSRYHILTAGAQKFLMEYPWRGNLIQVRSFCERLILTANKRTIDELEVKRLFDSLYSNPVKYSPSPRSGYENHEVIRIQQVLEKNAGNRERTAKELGISKATLWRHMKKYGIELK